jgi:hypothetical protein
LTGALCRFWFERKSRVPSSHAGGRRGGRSYEAGQQMRQDPPGGRWTPPMCAGIASHGYERSAERALPQVGR